MNPVGPCARLVAFAFLLPGCFGLRSQVGVRITPSDERVIRPDFTLGVHPGSWFPEYSHREFDAGAGFATDFDDVGAYAEATGVATQTRGIPTLAAEKDARATMLDRQSVGGVLRWAAKDGFVPSAGAVTSNELSGFSREMHSDGGVWGEIAAGVYAGVAISPKGKWTLSTGVQAHMPIIGIDKM